MCLLSNFVPCVGVIDADARLPPGKADEDGAVLEVVAIARRQGHAALGIEGVLESAR